MIKELLLSSSSSSLYSEVALQKREAEGTAEERDVYY